MVGYVTVTHIPRFTLKVHSVFYFLLKITKVLDFIFSPSGINGASH